MSSKRILDQEQSFTTILLGWGLGSVVIGFGLLRSDNPLIRGIGEQFIAWGGIDALLATNGLRGNASDRNKVAIADKSAHDIHNKAQFLERILWFNSGLDILYLAGGIWLLNDEREKRRGWGIAVLMQALFLLFFDITFARGMNRAR